MYYLLAMLTGFVVAVMVAVNGGLSTAVGPYIATVIIHIAGLLGILLVCAFRRESLRVAKRLPPLYFLGGVVGVGSTVFNNIAFAHIGVTAILALGLLGQASASLVLDHTSLFGGQKLPFKKGKLVGYAAILAGTAVMLLETGGGA